MVILPLVFILQAAENDEMIELIHKLRASTQYIQVHPESLDAHNLAIFDHMSNWTARCIGHWLSFVISIVVVIAWVISGDWFDYNNTWWLLVNTYTCIVTYLLLFPLHNTELRRRRLILQHTACNITIDNGTTVNQTQQTLLQRMDAIFELMSDKLSECVAHSFSMILAIISIIAWAVAGPFMNFDNTWQLVVNTVCMAVQLLLFVLLQCAMNRSTKKIHTQLTQLQMIHNRLHQQPTPVESTTLCDVHSNATTSTTSISTLIDIERMTINQYSK